MELFYRLCLLAYPRVFRAEFGPMMLEMYRIQRRRARTEPGRFRSVAFLLFTIDDVVRNVIAERSRRWSRIPDPLSAGSGRGPLLPSDRLDMMQNLLTEARHAARRLAQSPAFTITGVLITALGIGANSAIFSFVDALLLRPPAYERPEEVVAIYQDSDEGQPNSSSFPAYRDMAAYDQLFAATAALMPFGATLVTDEGVEELAAEWVTSSYFSMLELRPTLGRDFEPRDDVDGGEPVAIISYGMWQERYGADPGVLGERLRINGAPVTVVGVGPRGYSGILPGFELDIWLSLSTIRPAMGDYPGGTLERRADHWFQVRARLAEGVTVAQAQAAMDQLADRLATEFPEFNSGRGITVFAPDEVRMHPDVDGQLVPLSAGLMTVVGLVLFIACSNLAGLLLVRGSARSREVAIRLALGASRARVVGNVIAESVLISLAGGAIGLVLALWATRAFVAADLPLPLPAAVDLRLDWRVFGFTLVLSVATGVLFGLLPGMRIARSDVTASLRDDVTGMFAGGSRFNLRNALVVGQVAVSFVILFVAGLFLRSLAITQGAPVGFDPRGLAVISTNTAYAGYSAAEGGTMFGELRRRVEALPGIDSAALAAQLPVRGGGGSSTLVVEGYTPSTGTESVEVLRSVIGPGYFATLGVPVLHGRAFTQADVDTNANVAMVSAAFGRTFFGTPDAVGRRFRGQGSETWVDIVGVVADVKIRNLTEEPTPVFYYPYGPGGMTFSYVVARTDGDPETLLQPMRAELREIDPLLAVASLQTFDHHLADAVAAPRLGARMLTAFGILGLALASLGLYAVVAFAVERRTTELGIRMAIGADAGNVVRLVLYEVLAIVACAVVVGVGLTLLVAPALSSGLYGVSGADPLTLAGTAVFLALTAAAAAWLPARRAAGVDPVLALRHDR